MQTTSLMQSYVGTVNRAIDTNRDNFPYKQLINVSNPAVKDLEMQVAIYKDDIDHPQDYFTLKWTGSTLEIAGHGKDEDADLAWSVPRGHLKEVIDDPEPFVKNPARLDLDWLGRRLGVA